MSINEAEYRRQLEGMVNVLKVLIQQHEGIPGADGTGSITIHHSGAVELTIGSEYGEISHYTSFAVDMDEAMEQHWNEGGT